MRCSPSIVQSFTWLAGLCVLMGVANSGWAQKQLKDKETLTKEFLSKDARHKALMAGEATSMTNAADKAVADAAAEWYILRVVWRVSGDSAKHFDKIQQEFALSMKPAITPPIKTSKEYSKMFAAALVKHMGEIVAFDLKEEGYATTVINACMMMPTMAKLKQESIADFLIEQVNKNPSDVVRLYALKALGEFMPVKQQEEDVDLKAKPRQDQIRIDAKVVDTLAKFIENPNIKEVSDSEGVAVIQYVRREAIASLARAGAPAVIALKKPARLDGPIAPTLLKVLAGGMTPPPTLPEKIEAALGLCAMKYKDMPEYEPELAVYLVAKTIEEFVKEYQADYGNFAAKGPQKVAPRIFWKAEAKRFETGLTEIVKNASDANAAGALKNAQSLKTNALPLVQAMDKYGFQNNQQVLEFGKQIQRYAPKSGVIFKSAPNLSVPLSP